MPEKNSGENKICVKKYNGGNGLQRKAILYAVIPGKIKNISEEVLSTTSQMNILAGNLQ